MPPVLPPSPHPPSSFSSSRLALPLSTLSSHARSPPRTGPRVRGSQPSALLPGPQLPGGPRRQAAGFVLTEGQRAVPRACVASLLCLLGLGISLSVKRKVSHPFSPTGFRLLEFSEELRCVGGTCARLPLPLRRGVGALGTQTVLGAPRYLVFFLLPAQRFGNRLRAWFVLRMESAFFFPFCIKCY